MITSASHEHDAGAGHDHGHASGLTAEGKSLMLAAFVIVALAATIWYLLPAHEAREKRTTPQEAAGRLVVAEGSSDAGRVKFATKLQHRFADKNRSVNVDADGVGYKVLRLRWPPGKIDREHIDQLQRADPFLKEARGHGFTHVVMQVGERIVWQKTL